jgi:large subunit ribosomal protein L23
MALKDLFGRKKKAEIVEEKTTKKTTAKKSAPKKVEKVAKTEAKTEVVKNTDVKSKYSYRITEKATKMSDKNVFVLNVPKETNKIELKKELVKKYKVTVLGIRMVNIAKKAKVYRGRAGHRGGGKKAYVTVKAGESIVL